jgi:hypothetical protein
MSYTCMDTDFPSSEAVFCKCTSLNTNIFYNKLILFMLYQGGGQNERLNSSRLCRHSLNTRRNFPIILGGMHATFFGPALLLVRL